jgi:hypothetical protein
MFKPDPLFLIFEASKECIFGSSERTVENTVRNFPHFHSTDFNLLLSIDGKVHVNTLAMERITVRSLVIPLSVVVCEM